MVPTTSSLPATLHLLTLLPACDPAAADVPYPLSAGVNTHGYGSSLKCRSTPLAYIRRRQPENGFGLFESESLRWPGFVEFDDVNGKVLTYSAKNKVYKVWDLINYTMLYEIKDKDIQEIKIRWGQQRYLWE